MTEEIKKIVEAEVKKKITEFNPHIHDRRYFHEANFYDISKLAAELVYSHLQGEIERCNGLLKDKLMFLLSSWEASDSRKEEVWQEFKTENNL